MVIGNTLFQQHNSTHGHFQTVNTEIRLIIFSAAKDREALIQSAETRPCADCDSDQKLLNAKFRCKLKKVGETTRSFRYDLSQIFYDCVVEVMNRLNGLNMVDRVSEELWTEVLNLVEDVVTKTIPNEKQCKKAKWLSEGALHIAEKRREVTGKAESERYIQLNAEFQRIARRDKKAFLSEQCK